MIIYKIWKGLKFSERERVHYKSTYDGWFLFGIIPLYIRRIKTEKSYTMDIPVVNNNKVTMILTDHKEIIERKSDQNV